MIFQISDLNALGRAPQTGDVFAIDTGTDTAKIDYNALATAIINKLGGDPVTIAHGGTNATTADGACENIGAVKKSGDTMSGWLTAPVFQSKGVAYQFYLMADENGTETGHVRAERGDTNSNNRIVFRAWNGDKYEDFFLPIANANTDTNYDILTNKTPVTVAQGGTGVNGVEESQISINPDLAALGINVGLRDNITAAAKIRRWGKLYTMQYDVVLNQSTYTGATNWQPLIVDNKGWLSSQAANMPYFAWANSDYQLLKGINLWCENRRTYGVSYMSMNLTWIDPN